MSLRSKVKNIDYFTYMGIIGGLLVTISEFLPWFSNNSLILIYLLSSISPQAFIYFFPLMSGIICLFGSSLYGLRPNLKINSIIIELVGLGFNTIFILDFIVNQVSYLLAIQIGFYFFIIGFSLIFIEIISKLIQKEGPSGIQKEKNDDNQIEKKL